MSPIHRFLVCLVVTATVCCAQESIELPDVGGGGGSCGEWYPGGGNAADAGDLFAVEVGKIFPCAVFESAMLAGERTYINLPDIYLAAKHGRSDTRSIVFVNGASNCPGCAVLVEELVALAGDFEAAGALMIGAAWCNNMDINDCDFDVATADAVLRDEGWPSDRWYTTNDQEGYFRPSFSDVFPSVVVVRVSNMVVEAVEIAPDAEGVLSRVQTMP